MSKELNMEGISMEIISYAGVAKSNSIMAINKAKENKIDEANNLIKEAKENLVKVAKAHMQVLQYEAQGNKTDINLLFIHAEDQYLTTQMMVELALNFIDIYQSINQLKNK